MELVFPIALRYERLVRKVASRYTLEDARPSSSGQEPLQWTSSEEIQEALTALWSAVQTHEATTEIPIPGYLKKQLKWHMGEQFRRRSAETTDAEGKRKRVLKSAVERSGGLPRPTLGAGRRR